MLIETYSIVVKQDVNSSLILHMNGHVTYISHNHVLFADP